MTTAPNGHELTRYDQMEVLVKITKEEKSKFLFRAFMNILFEYSAKIIPDVCCMKPNHDKREEIELENSRMPRKL